MRAEEKQDFYLSQVRRLGGLEFTPQTAEAWAELAKVLKRVAKSEEHAKRIVGRFTEEGAPSRCPTPGDIALMARGVPVDPNNDRSELPEPCSECAPFDGAYRLVVTASGVECMGRCGCPRGIKLRALVAAVGGRPEPTQWRDTSLKKPLGDGVQARLGRDVK